MLSGRLFSLWCLSIGGCFLSFLLGLLFLVALGLVESADVGVGKKVGAFLLLYLFSVFLERQGLFPLLVEFYHFSCPFGRNVYKVGSDVLVGGVGDNSRQDVGLEIIVVASCVCRIISFEGNLRLASM